MASPLREKRALAETRHVSFERLPFDVQKERLGTLDSLMKDAAPVARGAGNHGACGPQAVPELIGGSGLCFQKGNLEDHSRHDRIRLVGGQRLAGR